MMKKVTLTKLESIMQRMRKALRTIEKVSLELGLPGVQVRLDPLLQVAALTINAGNSVFDGCGHLLLVGIAVFAAYQILKFLVRIFLGLYFLFCCFGFFFALVAAAERPLIILEHIIR